MRPCARYLLALLAVLAGQAVVAQQVVAAPPVIVANVERTHISNPIEALGTLSARESIALTARVTDAVRAIHFRDGQRVDAGKLLIEIDNAEEQAQLEEARVTRDEAERQLDRVRALVDKGSASDAELDVRRREFEVAKARYQITRAQLNDRVIRAPFSGRVGLRQISPGALVSPGQVLTTLDDDSVMQLDFPVPSLFLDQIAPGASVEARVRAFPQRVFPGKVVAIAGRVDPITRTITARAHLDNSDFLLRAGLLVTVTLHSRAREALTVPEAAIITEGKQNHVLIIESRDGQTLAMKRTVNIGSRISGNVEIVRGLDEGEQVIIHGTQHARPGKPVSVRLLEGETSIADMLRDNSSGAN